VCSANPYFPDFRVVAKTSRNHIRVVAVAFIMSLLFRGGDAFQHLHAEGAAPLSSRHHQRVSRQITCRLYVETFSRFTAFNLKGARLIRE
jgi:hypothetical protein